MGNNRALKRLTLTALLLALCIIGANIKILGSIALDSAPAFLGTLLLGPWVGAFLGFFGHMTSAMLSGFPLTLPVHLIVGGMMAVCMFVFGYIRQKLGLNRVVVVILSDVIAYIINVPLEIPLLYPLLKGAIIALFIPLTIATIVNLVICELLYVVLPQSVKQADFIVGKG
ncbi:ECF transporter S component [Levilactobacillus yiduensis]|uniref:ECF transporter S component n=1 Tax=Levilactobacillus yiduensis TaxID=2953880 RepID=UPI000EF2D91E|nr:ECF transporter S component [Levilactobacillus yiduensis]AYM02449.1 ECF transporter S component [Levilactobacillus brevis]